MLLSREGEALLKLSYLRAAVPGQAPVPMVLYSTSRRDALEQALQLMQHDGVTGLILHFADLQVALDRDKAETLLAAEA